MKKNIISDLFTSLKRRPEVRALIPMGYTPGIPTLSSRQDELCVEIPFLRYRTTGEKDHTLVYPIKYVLTYVVPEMNVVNFVDYAFTPVANQVDFNKPVGYFRHEAIANLTRKEYDELRISTLSGLDYLAIYLLGEGEHDSASEKRLTDDLSRIIEPSLYPFYKSLSPNFFEKFINNG